MYMDPNINQNTPNDQPFMVNSKQFNHNNTQDPHTLPFEDTLDSNQPYQPFPTNPDDNSFSQTPYLVNEVESQEYLPPIDSNSNITTTTIPSSNNSTNQNSFTNFVQNQGVINNNYDDLTSPPQVTDLNPSPTPNYTPPPPTNINQQTTQISTEDPTPSQAPPQENSTPEDNIQAHTSTVITSSPFFIPALTHEILNSQDTSSPLSIQPLQSNHSTDVQSNTESAPTPNYTETIKTDTLPSTQPPNESEPQEEKQKTESQQTKEPKEVEQVKTLQENHTPQINQEEKEVKENTESNITPNTPTKDWTLALILSFFGFLGVAGLHRFYTGKIMTGLLMFITLGGLGLWTLIDIFQILTDSYTDSKGILLKKKDK